MNQTLASFQHQQSAHCESGVVSALLHHAGKPVSEAMAFGLSSALSFAYIPLVKINGLPLIAYRMPPRFIIRGLKSQLKLPFRFETFRSPQAGQQRLDDLLAQGKLVGLQTSVFFLPYFPVNMRFHFNAHNLMVYGKQGGDYLVSDPVFEFAKTCPVADMQRARFVRGMLAPRGLLYYLDGPVPDVAMEKLIPAALKKTTNIMLHTPLPFVGVKGIRLLSRKLLKLDPRDADGTRRYAGHVVRMQEEIGTGGAGFRFLYAAFLQEAAQLLNRPALKDLSLQLTAIGDRWREFALAAARMNKGRTALDLPLLHQHLQALADDEQQFFAALKKAA